MCVTQYQYAPSFRSSCKIWLILRVDTLLSIAIRFCFCSGFHHTHSRTAGITFSRCAEYRHLSPSILTMLPILLYRFTMRKTNRQLIPSSFSRITISLWDHPHVYNTIVTILFSCFSNSIFTRIANYWLMEGKSRDTLQACMSANPDGKKFLDMQSVYQNLWLYYVE